MAYTIRDYFPGKKQYDIIEVGNTGIFRMIIKIENKSVEYGSVNDTDYIYYTLVKASKYMAINFFIKQFQKFKNNLLP